jgi:uncharacterized membrane protein
MARIRPIHGIAFVLAFLALLLYVDWAMGSRNPRTRVSPDQVGMVRIDVADLGKSQVRFYRFLNSGNQEVLFLVGRDRSGTIQVGFDAAETHYKRRRGFRHEGDWLVDNTCDTAVRLEEVNTSRGGCRPVPVKHRMEGNTLVISEADMLAGWRLFR